MAPAPQARDPAPVALASTAAAGVVPGALVDVTVAERVLNVLLFVPLGVGVGLVGRPAARRWLIGAALLLPFAVEGLQAVVTVLSRGPQWQDVLDNLIGVLVGLALAWAIRVRAQRRAPA